MLICCRAAVDIQLSVYSFQNACNIRTLSTDWRPSNQKAPELQQHLLPGSPTPSPRHCSADKGRGQAGSRPAPSLPPSAPLRRRCPPGRSPAAGKAAGNGPCSRAGRCPAPVPRGAGALRHAARARDPFAAPARRRWRGRARFASGALSRACSGLSS